MRFPWQKRMDAAKAQAVKAENEYRWAVQSRTAVSTLVRSLVYQGQQNELIEKLNIVARGGHR